MKFKKLLKKIGLAGFALAMLSGIAIAGVKPAFAVPYEGEDTPGLDHPAFNVYTGVPSVGDEADFFRGKLEGTTGYVDPVNAACEDGTRFQLRVYVHNAANQGLNDNGNGTGVAHGTKVRVTIQGEADDSFDLNSTISATNVASVTDGLGINCTNGKTVKMSYVNGSAFQYTVPGGTQDLSDSIVTTGAPIGTNVPNGDVWGCWDQRVWVGLMVEVKEVVTPPPVTPPTPKPETPVTVKELPDTGAGDLVAIFVATTFAGMVAYRVVLARKN